MKFFTELYYQILQYTGRAFTLTSVQIIAALIIILLNLSFLYFFHWGVFSIVAAQFASTITIFVIAIFFSNNASFFEMD